MMNGFNGQYGQNGQLNGFHAIRLRISLQYGEKGSVNYLLTPDCGDRWEQVVPQDSRTTMRQLFESPVSAYQLGNYAQLGGLVYTHIIPNPVDFRGGFIQTSLYVDRRYQLAAPTILEALGKTEHLLLAQQERFHASIKGQDYAYKQQVQAAADAMLQELTRHLKPALGKGVAKQAPVSTMTYYRVVTNRQQLEEIFSYPDQGIFTKTPLLTIVESAPYPASPLGHSFVPYDRTGKCVEVREPIVKPSEFVPATNGKMYGLNNAVNYPNQTEKKSFFKKNWPLLVAFCFGVLFAYLVYCVASVMNDHNPWPFQGEEASPLPPPIEGESDDEYEWEDDEFMEEDSLYEQDYDLDYESDKIPPAIEGEQPLPIEKERTSLIEEKEKASRESFDYRRNQHEAVKKASRQNREAKYQD